MTNKQLKRYQEKAVEKLISRTKELFDDNVSRKTIIFQSPTGSGKTFMMSQYITQLIDEFEDENLCFLWVSIGKGELQKQSYHSLKREFDGFPDCHLLEQEYFGTRRVIEKNKVVVVNWEKLRTKDKQTGEWKNILMKDKETINFRELLKNTREEGTKIIMIIDESHSNATSERAIELRDDIVKADLTIEMSATPVIEEEGANIRKWIVEPNDVIEEGMIKKEVIINENLDEISDDDTTSQELILLAAYLKRLQIKKQFEEIDVNINPLVLVQLPTAEEGHDKREFVETFLAEKNITLENGKLAIWLSEEKVNLEILENNVSNVEFLIFKQAIDTGWDCPRAQILVRFREIKSMVFEIQTIGRILRMPEAMHYLNDNLNKAYVYTNVKTLAVKKETYNPNIIKSIFVKRKDIYTPLKLRSYYRNRVDFGDVTASFYQTLEKVLCRFFNIPQNQPEFFDKNKELISQKIYIENLEYHDEIFLNKPINMKYFDHLVGHRIVGYEQNIFENPTLMQSLLSEDDKYWAFINIIKENLGGFAPKRSIKSIYEALFRWFRKFLGIELYGNGTVYIQNIVLNNSDIFAVQLDIAIREYRPEKEKEIARKIEEIEEWNEAWEISESMNFNPHVYKPFKYDLSIYFAPSDNNCYLNFDSNIEKEFVEQLEKRKDDILWWWQNGNEHMAVNFGIKYNNGSTFQPDFLVQFKDGRLGIFDTKAFGDREDVNKLKAEALQEYIETEKQKGKNLFGGIVIKAGKHFRINSNPHYKPFKDTQSDFAGVKEKAVEYNAGDSKKVEWDYFDDIF